MTYAVLPRASGNRVYGAASLPLARAELAMIDRLALGGVVGDLAEVTLGGVPYLQFTSTAGGLTPFQVDVVSNLSTTQALFIVEGETLRPVTVRPRLRFDDDIISIQRYVGKTNESFTRLLVNLTLAASRDGFRRLLDDDPVRLLDPLCGRGTSLNHAVLYGLEAYGLEIDSRDFDAYRHFIVTWLQNHRIKHHVEEATLRRGRESKARRLAVSYGHKGSKDRHRIEVVNDDTLHAADHFKKRSMDLLVADLPYGVHHETRLGAGRISRRPDELLRKALPEWRQLLHPDGAIGLAWNTRTLPRSQMLNLLQNANLHPIHPLPHDSFLHRVDKTITRDLIVATLRGGVVLRSRASRTRGR